MMNLSIPEKAGSHPTQSTAAAPANPSLAGPARSAYGLENGERQETSPFGTSRGASAQDTSRQMLLHSAQSVFERIRRDRDQVPAKLKPLLSYIEAHLFHPELSVNRMKRDCGVRDNSVAIHFHACVGQPPHAYISQCRMDVAARLLSDSDLPVWKISEMLGFSSIQVFSRAFYRCAQQRPSTYRRRHRPILRAADGSLLSLVSNPEAHTGEGLPPEQELWHRALTGRLLDDEAAELIRRLLDLYPPHRRFPG